jgi:glycosyltransferase involved in cell wall biosynthesis
MRKVLVVAYAFPPVGGAGVQRVVKFLKYMKKLGWSGDAVSVLNPSVPVVDDSLLLDLPSDCTVYRSKTLEPSYAVKASVNAAAGQQPTLKSRVTALVKKVASQVLLPDPQVLWWPHTFLLLRRILKKRQHDVVFVSGPPFSSFFLTVVTAKLYRVPTVIDYRDEWSFSRVNWENSAKSALARLVDAWMERHVVRNCDAITVASPFYERSLKSRFPFAAQKIHTITNGFDPEDFADVSFPASDAVQQKTTILYTGTVWKATSFQGFEEGIRLLAREDRLLADKTRLCVVGRILKEEQSTIDRLRRYIEVVTVDYLPHEKIFREMAAADLLLLTLSDLPGAEKIIPGKTFEYLATPIPILAVIPKGVTAEIVGAQKNVFVAEPNDPHAIKDALVSVIGRQCPKEFRDGIEEYNRFFLARKLADLLERLSEVPDTCTPVEVGEVAR